MTSKASSRIPNPPGMATKAEEYFTSITSRMQKVLELDEFVEVGIRFLLVGQHDIA